MESNLRKPFNLTGLILTINSTQDKLLLEHKSLQELQSNVDTLNEMKTIPEFSFHPLNALTYDSHKLVTMGLSYTVILILMILVCMCCFNVYTGFYIIMLWTLQMHFLSIQMLTASHLWKRD